MLGFIEAKGFRTANQLAYLKWPCPAGHVLLAIPLRLATERDIADARAAEADGLGPDLGKSRVFSCSGCHMSSSHHPRSPFPQCPMCGNPLASSPSKLLDRAKYLADLIWSNGAARYARAKHRKNLEEDLWRDEGGSD